MSSEGEISMILRPQRMQQFGLRLTIVLIRVLQNQRLPITGYSTILVKETVFLMPTIRRPSVLLRDIISLETRSAS